MEAKTPAKDTLKHASGVAVLLFLARKIDSVPRLSTFKALHLLTTYMPIHGKYATPASKRLLSQPLQASAAASLIAALPLTDRPSTATTLSHILSTSLQTEVTSEALVQLSETILQTSKTDDTSFSTPAILSVLHQQLSSNPLCHVVALDYCYDVLEILCLADNDTNCLAVLERGKSLLAGAIIAAVYCCVTPSHSEQGAEVLKLVAQRVGFPEEVVLAQVQSVLHTVLVGNGVE